MIYGDDNIHEALEKIAGERGTGSMVAAAAGAVGAGSVLGRSLKLKLPGRLALAIPGAVVASKAYRSLTSATK